MRALLQEDPAPEALLGALQAISARHLARGLKNPTDDEAVQKLLDEPEEVQKGAQRAPAKKKAPRRKKRPKAKGKAVSAPGASQEAALVPIEEVASMPPILAGSATPAVEAATDRFYRSVATMFEAWLARRRSHNTRRAYRRDVMDFIEFLGIRWPTQAQPEPDESWRLLQAKVPQVQAWRDYLAEERGLAPLTLNRRLSSVSGFYRFLREAAAEARLPITVPNPAHSQFLGREVQEPVSPTEALSASRARQLMALPEGEEVLAKRDRAILKFYLFTGARIGTGCRLLVEDFRDVDDDPKVLIQEKGRGRSKRPLGVNVVAADALREYIASAGLSYTSGEATDRHSRPLDRVL